MKLLVKDVLDKIIYKATIQTYKQNMNSSYGLCLQEGYSSDMKDSIWAECEVENIAYDNHRKRISIVLEEEECLKLLKTKSTNKLETYLTYHQGYRFSVINSISIKLDLRRRKIAVSDAFHEVIGGKQQ